MKWPALCQKFQDIKKAAIEIQTRTLGKMNTENEKRNIGIKNSSVRSPSVPRKMVDLSKGSDDTENPCAANTRTAQSLDSNGHIQQNCAEEDKKSVNSSGVNNNGTQDKCDLLENTSCIPSDRASINSHQDIDSDNDHTAKYMVNQLEMKGNDSPTEQDVIKTNPLSNEIHARENHVNQNLNTEGYESPAEGGRNCYVIIGSEKEITTSENEQNEFPAKNGLAVSVDPQESVDEFNGDGVCENGILTHADVEIKECHILEEHDVKENKSFEQGKTKRALNLDSSMENRQNYSKEDGEVELSELNNVKGNEHSDSSAAKEQGKGLYELHRKTTDGTDCEIATIIEPEDIIIELGNGNILFLKNIDEKSLHDSDTDSGLQTEEDETYIDEINDIELKAEDIVDDSRDHLNSQPDAVNHETADYESCCEDDMQIIFYLEDSKKHVDQNFLPVDMGEVETEEIGVTSEEIAADQLENQQIQYGSTQMISAQGMEGQPIQIQDGGMVMSSEGVMVVEGQQIAMQDGSSQVINAGTVQVMDGGQANMVKGGQYQVIDGGQVQMIDGGSVQMIDGQQVQIIDGGQVQMMDGGNVQMMSGGAVQTIDGGSVQMIDGEQYQMMDGGSVKMMDGGTVQMVDGGQVQMMEGGSVQMMDGGSIQTIDGGQVQMIDGGSVQMMDGGQVHMMDAGSVQMIDGGSVQMIDGGSIQMIDGGSVQMMGGGQIQMIDGGQVQMMDGGSIRIEDGGQIQMMDGGSVQNVDGSTVQVIDGGMIQGNYGGVEMTTVDMIEIQDNSAVDRSAEMSTVRVVEMQGDCSSQVVSEEIPLEMSAQDMPLETSIQEIGVVECGSVETLEMSCQEIPLGSQADAQLEMSVHETPLDSGFQVEEIGVIETVEEVPLESQVQECPLDVNVQEIPLESQVQEVPLEMSVQEIPVGSEYTETPLGSTEYEEYPLDSSQVQEFPLESTVEEFPLEHTVQEFPLESTVEEIPLENTVKEFALESTVEELPLENTVQEYPLESTVEETPLENTVQEYPIESTVQEIPLENTVQEFPLESTVEELPLEHTVQEYPLESEIDEVPLDVNQQGLWTVEEVGTIMPDGTTNEITETPLEPINSNSWNVDVIGTVDSGAREKCHTCGPHGTCHGQGACYHQAILEEYKEKCHRLERDKEYLEGRYDELKRERETLEVRYTELASSMHDCRSDRLKDFVIDTSNGEYTINTNISIPDCQHIDEQCHHPYQSYDTSSYPTTPRDSGRMECKWQADVDYYRSKCDQVRREKEILERAFEGEKRRNEDKEKAYENEKEDRRHLEEQTERLNTNITRMQETIRSLRRDNETLTKSLKTLERSPISIQSHFNNQTTTFSNVTEVNEYKSHLEVLERENKEFRDILAHLDGKKTNSVHMDFDVSKEQEYMDLKREKNKLEIAVKDLKRTVKHQQDRIEEIRRESDEEGWNLKEKLRKLERKNKEHDRILHDRDRELDSLKKRNFEECCLLEVKFRSEVSAKAQLQKQIIDFQNRVQRLERERDSLTEQMRSTHHKDSVCTNVSGDNDMEVLRKRFEEEHHSKVRLANDIKYLLNDIMELRNRNRQLEDNFSRERMEIKTTIEKQAVEITQAYMEEINKLQLSLAEEVRRREQLELERVETMHNQMAAVHVGATSHDGNDMRTRLLEEIKRRETLEVENKNLLYEMNNVLTKSRRTGNDADEPEDDDADKIRKLIRQKEILEKNNKELVNEVDDFNEKVEELQGSVKKVKELKRTNEELEQEVKYLKRKREEMDTAQKALHKEIDQLSMNVTEVERRNRQLTDEFDRLTRKMQDMEDGFKEERSNLARKLEREKDKAVDEMSRLRDDSEFKLKEQIMTTRQLESTIKNLEYQMRTMMSVGTIGGGSGSESGGNSAVETIRQQMNSYVDSLKKQIENLEDVLKDRNRKHESETGKFETQKKQMQDDFDREKQSLKQCFEREKSDLERRLQSIESEVRGDTGDGRRTNGGREAESIRRQFEVERNDLERRHIMEINKLQADFGRQLDEERNKTKTSQREFQEKLQTVRESKRDLEERLRDLDNRFRREIMDFEHRSSEEKRRNQEEVSDEIKRKMDGAKRSYQEEILRLNRAHEREKENFKDKLNKDGIEWEKKFQYERERLENKMQVKLSDVFREHRDEVNKLEKRLQKQFAEVENQKIIMTAKLDRQKDELTRKFEHDKRRLTESIQGLKREIHNLKYERRGDRDDRRRQDMEMKDNIERIRREETSRIETDFLKKISAEKRRMQVSVDDMRRKLSSSEQKVKEIEVQLDDEKHKFERERLEMEKNLIQSQQEVKLILEGEYRKKISDEKSKFERTLDALSKQVSCLQEQRRQIQAKLVSHETLGGTLENVTTEIRKNMLVQLEQDYNDRLEREKRPLEDKLSDMKHELEKLKREKVSIKTSLEREKAELEDELERLRDSMRGKLMRAREDLEKQSDAISQQTFFTKINSMTSSTSEDRNPSTKFYQEQLNILEQRNLSLQAKNDRLEKELRVMGERIRDLETRSRDKMASLSYDSLSHGYSYSGPSGSGGNNASSSSYGPSGGYGPSCSQGLPGGYGPSEGYGHGCCGRSGNYGPSGGFGYPGNDGHLGSGGQLGSGGHPSGRGGHNCAGGQAGDYGLNGYGGSVVLGASSQAHPYDAIMERAQSTILTKRVNQGCSAADLYHGSNKMSLPGNNRGRAGKVPMQNLGGGLCTHAQAQQRRSAGAVRRMSVGGLTGQGASSNLQRMAASRSIQANYSKLSSNGMAGQQVQVHGLAKVNAGMTVGNNAHSSNKRIAAASVVQGSHAVTQGVTASQLSSSAISHQTTQDGMVTQTAPAGLHGERGDIKASSPISPTGASTPGVQTRMRRMSQGNGPDNHSGQEQTIDRSASRGANECVSSDTMGDTAVHSTTVQG